MSLSAGLLWRLANDLMWTKTDRLAAAVRVDEAEALLIFPAAYFSLIAHACLSRGDAGLRRHCGQRPEWIFTFQSSYYRNFILIA